MAASGLPQKQQPSNGLSAKFFHKLASGVPGVLYTYCLSADSSQHWFPYISSRVQELFGLDPELLRQDAEGIFACIHPEDLAGMHETVVQSAAELAPWCYRARLRMLDGSYQWYEVHSRPERQEDGSTIWYGQFTNIQHYKTLEQSLRESEEEASYQARFQKLVARLSADFIHLGFGTIDECIDKLLAGIGGFFEVDRAYVYAFTDGYTHMTNTHEWCADGVPSLLASQQGVDIRNFNWWQNQIRRMVNQDAVVFVEDTRALPPEALAELGLLEEQGVRSMICAPVLVRGQVMGFFGVDSVSARSWRADQSELMFIVSGLLSGALERNRLEEDLVNQSVRDPLTGLYNRRYLMPRLHEMLAASRRHGERFCLAMFDIDHFKQVNDRLGHLAGDAILKRFTTLLRAHTRTNDLVSRYGGEEFLLVFNEVAADQEGSVVTRIIEAVRGEHFCFKDDQARITVSAGVVCLSELQGGLVTPEILIREADKRLYQAKEGGRDCLVDAGGLSRP